MSEQAIRQSSRPRGPQTPLEVTEWLFRQRQPFTAGMVVNRPPGGMSAAARLFQAGMWRRYAMDWDLPIWNLKRRWVESVLRKSRAECLRRARLNVYLARRASRSTPEANDHG